MTTDAASGESQDSRERILAAASAEFRAKGLAGARVDEIARLASCNKTLIYYYFHDKSGLYAASLRRMISRSHDQLGLRENVDRTALEWLRSLSVPNRIPEADWRRVWLWEAAEGPVEGASLTEERSSSLRSYVQRIVDAQHHGVLRSDIDAAQLGLALLALGNFAQIFPQLTSLITGLEADDPEFLRRQDEFFVAFTAALTPSAPD
jgi:TetR/AcrR family transcriptional regulator